MIANLDMKWSNFFYVPIYYGNDGLEECTSPTALIFIGLKSCCNHPKRPLRVCFLFDLESSILLVMLSLVQQGVVLSHYRFSSFTRLESKTLLKTNKCQTP